MEIKIFLTYKDFISLSSFFLTTFKAQFAPENTFDKPTGELLTSISEIKRHIEKYSTTTIKGDTFFITSPFWSVEPIFYEYVADNKNVGPFYYGQQRYGGPSFHFIPTFSKLHTQTSNKIIAGTLSDYSYYISGSFLTDRQKEYRTIARPETMKKAWKEVNKFIKQNGQPVAYRKGNHVILAFAMNDAISCYMNGATLLQGDQVFETD